MKKGDSTLSLYLRDLLFPPRCAGCGVRLVPFDPARPAFCPWCRVVWETAGQTSGLSSGVGDTAAWVYLVAYRPEDSNGVPEQVIYRIKHRDDSRVFAWLAAQLAQAVARYLESEGIPPEAVLLTYPPRRWAAVHQDGFDQAQRLAVCLSRQLGAPCLSLIRRSTWSWRRARREQEQKKLSAAQRQSNASATYRLSGFGVNLGRRYGCQPGKSLGPRSACKPTQAIAGRFVVLVDDLCTSGATLSACSSLLRRAGASGILWATVARTVSGGDSSDSGQG